MYNNKRLFYARIGLITNVTWGIAVLRYTFVNCINISNSIWLVYFCFGNKEYTLIHKYRFQLCIFTF